MKYLYNYLYFFEINALNNMCKKDLINLIKDNWMNFPWETIFWERSNTADKNNFEKLVDVLNIIQFVKCPRCGFSIKYFCPPKSVPQEIKLTKLWRDSFIINEINIVCECMNCASREDFYYKGRA